MKARLAYVTQVKLRNGTITLVRDTTGAGYKVEGLLTPGDSGVLVESKDGLRFYGKVLTGHDSAWRN